MRMAARAAGGNLRMRGISVVLVVVKHRHQHVEMREQIRDADGSAQLQGEIRTLPSLRKLLIQRQTAGVHHIPQRHKKLSQENFPSAARNHWQPGDERKGLLRQFWLIAAFAGKRGTEALGDGDA